MKSLKLAIKGIVQKVGYRNAVYRAARKMGIKGYVKNLDDPEESVEAVIQHFDEKVLEQLIEKININDGSIEVHEILKEKSEEKIYSKFELIRGSVEEENAERLDVAELQLKKLTDVVVSGNQKMIEKQDETIRVLSSKQDETIRVLSSKQDETIKVLGSKQDENTAALKGFREDTISSFDVVNTKYGKISEKLEDLIVILKKAFGQV